MANDWIKMRCDLFTHPKVVRISSALKADTLRTIGGLMSAWCLFDAHSIDGSLDGYTSETLDAHLRWDGFSAAMISVGWLFDDGTSLSLPDFETHNGESAKRRAQDADRKRKDRKVSASEPDESRTREEKRREDKNKEQEQKNSSPSGSRLAPDWSLPADWKTWAEQERPELDVLTQAASFADYWHGVAGAKGRKADWLATWRNWIRNSNAGSRPRAGPAFPPQKSKALMAIEKLQGMKNGLAENGNRNGVAEANHAWLGVGATDGLNAGNASGMDGSIDP